MNKGKLFKAQIRLTVELPDELRDMSIEDLDNDEKMKAINQCFPTPTKMVIRFAHKQGVYTLGELIDNWNLCLVERHDGVGTNPQKAMRIKVTTLLDLYGCIKRIQPADQAVWDAEYQGLYESYEESGDVSARNIDEMLRELRGEINAKN